MAGTAEKYLKPEVIRQVARLDLRAKFIVEGFIAGLHASPFHGFSVEFSEHRKYTSGDNISDIDWNVYAKTDRFYVKKFQAETNLTGYLAMDLSGSMGYTYRQELTKFEYSICLAAALCYLMIHQQDPVGVMAFDEKVRQSLAPASKRSQLGNVLSLLARLQPSGTTDIEASLHQVASMIRHRSLVMVFSDLLADFEPIRRRYTGCGSLVMTSSCFMFSTRPRPFFPSTACSSWKTMKRMRSWKLMPTQSRQTTWKRSPVSVRDIATTA